MSFRDCLIVERPDDWFIVVGRETEHLAADVSIEELVTCVNLMVKLAGLKAPNCVIAPAATSCFFATIQGGDELDVRDRNALIYELESHIPLDAEAMVADFVVATTPTQRSTADDTSESKVTTSPVERGKTVSAIAVEVARWRELAEALETSGIPVRCIAPSATLATRALCRDLDLTRLTELLLVDDSQCDAVKVEADSITAWKHLAIDDTTLRRHRVLDSAEIAHGVVVGADELPLTRLREAYQDVDLQTLDRSLESLWIDGATLALSKQTQRWFDLRRDQLGPSDPLRPILPQLRLVTAAAVLFALAIAIGGWWRGQRIEHAIDQINADQRAAFEEAFPGSQVPAALVRRVRSEHTKVMGSRGATAEIDLPQSATEVLRQLLAALPESLRFRIKSLKIFNGQVDLELQVRTAVDAGALATALESHGFEVEPPVTTRKDAQTFDSVSGGEMDWPPVEFGGRGIDTMKSNSTSRTRLWIVIALLILGVYAVISILQSRSAAQRLAQASEDLSEVSAKLLDIKRLQRAPKVAALQLESPAEIANRIADALQAAGLSESSLMKEEPSDPQRVQRTDFEMRSTVIDLAPATLPQILRFCEALRDPETGTMVRDMTLSAPRNEESSDGEERWETQLVLTQMIFSPKSR